jgi:hypothetical protein
MMPVLFNSALNKDALRYILVENLPQEFKSSQHQFTTKIPSKSAIRNAKQWAIASNLIDNRGLTAEGIIVITKDPYVETTVTDWLIHFHLSSIELSFYQYIVYEFLPEYSTFTQDRLLSRASERFSLSSPDKLAQNIRSLLKTYTDSQGIAKNQFLNKECKLYSIGNPDLSNFYITGYLLAKIWERDFENSPTVLVDRIIEAPQGLGKLLGIDEERLRQQLDILASHEIIEQRSIKPYIAGTKPPKKQPDERSYQVYRCWNNASELLEQAYDNDIATPNRSLSQSLAAILDDDDIPDFSKLFIWAIGLVVIKGGLNEIIRLAS